MTQTSDAPIWIVILRNVLISAAAGTLFGCALFPWFNAIRRVTRRDDYEILNNIDSLLMSTITSPALIFYIFPLLLPLIATACLVGIVFQKSIRKHLELWCVLSPIFVWLTVIAILIQTPPNSYFEQFTRFELFLIELPNPDHLPFLIGPAISAFVFYRLSRKGLKW